MKLSRLKHIIKEEIQQLNEGIICWGTINGVFGLNMGPAGDVCQECGACWNAGTCNGTTLFASADECNCHYHGTGCPDDGGGNVIQTPTIGKPKAPMGKTIR